MGIWRVHLQKEGRFDRCVILVLLYLWYIFKIFSLGVCRTAQKLNITGSFVNILSHCLSALMTICLHYIVHCFCLSFFSFGMVFFRVSMVLMFNERGIIEFYDFLILHPINFAMTHYCFCSMYELHSNDMEILYRDRHRNFES